MLNSNLKAFVRVAECGSFTKAAESLYSFSYSGDETDQLRWKSIWT